MAGFFASIGERLERKAVPLDFLPGYLLGPEAKAGVSVTWATALQVSTVLAVVKVIAEGIAQCGAKLMQPMAGSGFGPATTHPLYRLLYRRPNGWQTAFEFWETILAHLVLLGNAFVFVSRTDSGRILELIPLTPNKVRVTRLADLTLVYDVTGEDGQMRRFGQDRIWHLRGVSWDGWMGMEPVRLAREAIGLAIALEQSHAEQHKNGLKTPGIYSIEGSVNEAEYEKLLKWIKSVAAKNEPMILDRGAKWFQQQMTGVDAQHVETRRLQIEEICRAFRVMPIMVGMADKTATYASVEQMMIAHVTHCLAPWAKRIEESAEVNLLSDSDQAAGYYVKINLNALMRGDFKTRQEGLQIQRRNGIINANQWRALEDMAPRTDDGGEQYIVEANMALQDGRDLPPPRPSVPTSTN